MMRKRATGGLVAGLVLLPMAVLAQTATAGDFPDAKAEAALMAQAKITLAGAGDMAVKLHPGTLAEIGFNDENGQGVYEAHVVDGTGKTWIVKIDAVSGDTLAMGDATLIGDGEMADNGEGGDAGSDGEHADGGGRDGEQPDGNGMTEGGNG